MDSVTADNFLPGCVIANFKFYPLTENSSYGANKVGVSAFCTWGPKQTQFQKQTVSILFLSDNRKSAENKQSKYILAITFYN
jgi:hypothetical protein